MYSIKVENLYKKFDLNKTPDTLKDFLINLKNNTNKEEYWVLNDVNMTINKGEAIGIIGKNGSGKSTLLKILSSILYPTKGEVKVNGKISSLLELGAGFKPDYSGRENVYLNASILGYSKKEIDKKFDSIVKFAELEDFIDQPVRNYSSGMYMRLAYSIAVSTNPDILIVDEILAVGDKNFKDKGLNRILDLKTQGTTILLVSHSEAMVKKVCDRVIWLEDGKVRRNGDIEEIYHEYKG